MSMLSVSKLLPQGRGLSAVLVKRAASVELDWDVRQKSRFEATDTQGRTLGVFLPRGSAVRGGDVLVAEDGSLIRVVAKPQPLLIVTACAEHGSSFDLLRAAYHLGNRHVPLQLEPDRLKLEPDHVLAEMLRRMHLIVDEADAAFEPETGAYATDGHAHGGAGAHAHEYGGGHAHGHAPAQANADVHGHGHEQVHEHRHEPVREDAGDEHEHRQAHGETHEPPGDHTPDPARPPGPPGEPAS